MTAALAAHSIEQGLIDLDTRTGDMIGANLAPQADSRTITIGQLVTHSSGLARLDPGFVWKIRLSGTAVDPYRMYSRDQLFDFLNQWKRPSQLNSQYSNLGIDLLGVVLSELLKVPLEEALRSYIWKPLGMRDTYLNTGEHDTSLFGLLIKPLGPSRLKYNPDWTGVDRRRAGN
ncbi:MAG: beta-lactamase family protein [Alicyclobacillus sp.]|nr:beta-lactamase family protein [Alicyclobacillus sp.]